MAYQALVSFLVCVFLPALCGVVLVCRFTSQRERLSLLAFGVVAGLSLYVTLTFLLTSVFDLRISILVSTVFILLLAVFYLDSLSDVRRELFTDPVIMRLAPVFLLVAYCISSRVLLVSKGLLRTGHLNCFGDLPLHVGLVTNFVEGQSFPPESPILSNTQLVYPFLSDFYSAVLIGAGMSLEGALELPATLLITAGFIVFYRFVCSLTESRSAGLIAALLLLFHGGVLGFLRLEDLSPGSFLRSVTYADLPYLAGAAGDAEGYFLPSALLAYFIPQRSFLFGFSLAITVLTLFREVKDRGSALFVGILIGLIPLFHAHTALAVALPLLYFSFFLPFRLLLWVLLTALPIGLVEVSYYAFQSATANHISFNPGWMIGSESPIWFWFKNTGFIIPVVFLSLFLRRIPRDVKSLAVIGYVLFIFCSIFLFARWKWDNTKLLIYAFIYFYPAVGIVLAKLYSRFQWKPVVILFVLFHSLSSALDLVRYGATRGKTYVLWDDIAINAAYQITKKVPAGESILSAPIHNSITLLSGRPMYLGFPGMIWTHGGNSYYRERAISRFYKGKNRNLPGDPELKYVLIGPVERKRYAPILIDPTWEKVAESRKVQVFRTR